MFTAATAARPTALRRLAHVGATAVRHTSALSAEKVIRPRHGATNTATGAVHLRVALEELGPLGVKFGQFLSASPDLLSEPYRVELAKLRDQVPAVPRADIVAAVEAEFGCPLDSVFSWFSPEPIAAASMSQVHEAALADGRQVAVKVRRPGIAETLEADLAMLAWTTNLASKLSRTARRCDLVGMVAEFGAMIHQELDFVTEAASAVEIGQLFAGDPTVVVPRIVTSLSGSGVIVMDLIDGIPLSDHAALEAAGYSRTALAESVIRTNLTMMLGPGRFHADPHAGNFLALSGDRLAILDFGATGLTSSVTRAAFSGLICALASGIVAELSDCVLGLTTATGPVDPEQLSIDLGRLLTPLTTASLESLEVGTALRSLLDLLATHGLQVRSDVALLVKAIIGSEATAAELDPAICLIKVLAPFVMTRPTAPSHLLAA